MKKIILNNTLLYLLLIFPILNGCQANSKVDEQFLNEFSESIRPQVRSLCERYSSKEQLNGIYYSQYALGIYTIIGIKNNNFEVLRFTDRNFLAQNKVEDVALQMGVMTKNKNWLNFKSEKNTNRELNDSNEIKKLFVLNKQSETFLIDDMEDVATSISWSKTMGSERSFLKKIQCTFKDYQAYKGEEEISPSYKDLPDELKALVIEEPLHLKIEFAEDISKKLKENDDPETAVEQKIKIRTPDTQKLFLNQPLCIIHGRDELWYGFMEKVDKPLSTAVVQVYTFEDHSLQYAAQQGDIVSTSEQDCSSPN